MTISRRSQCARPVAELAVEPLEPGDERIGSRRVAQRRGDPADVSEA